MNTIAERENLEFNITWAINNRRAISEMGYTLTEYIADDLARLQSIDLTYELPTSVRLEHCL